MEIGVAIAVVFVIGVAIYSSKKKKKQIEFARLFPVNASTPDLSGQSFLTCLRTKSYHHPYQKLKDILLDVL